MPPIDRLGQNWIRFAVAVTLVFGIAGTGVASVTAQSENPGLVSDTRYESPQFDYTLTWQTPWQVAAGSVVSNAGSYDQIGFENGGAIAQIVLLVPSTGLDDLFQQIEVGIKSGGTDVQTVAEERGDGYRTATLDLTAPWQGKIQRIRRYLEVADITSSAASPVYLFGAFGAPIDLFGDAWSSFAASVHRDDAVPVFRGTPSLSPATPVATEAVDADIPPGVITYDYISGQHDDSFHGWPEVPPVGGKHYSVWQMCQFYDQPIDPGKGVHSLEHGAVWITFAPDLPQDQIEKIKAIANGQDYVLASPYPRLPAPIVLTSWNHQLRLQSFDQDVIDRFIKVFKNSPKYTPEYGATCTGGSTDTIPS